MISGTYRWLFFWITIFSLLAEAESTQARDFRITMLPNALNLENADNRGCIACHIAPYPREQDENTERNEFGMFVETLVSEDGEEAFWGPSLAGEDADGDGFTNGEELGDPDGLALHRVFDISFDRDFPFLDLGPEDDPKLTVGNPASLSNPGLAESTPAGGSGAATATPTQAQATPTSTEPIATATPTTTEEPPTSTPTPTATDEPTQEEPTPTFNLDMDENLVIDVDDVLKLIDSGMRGPDWFRLSVEWTKELD